MKTRVISALCVAVIVLVSIGIGIGVKNYRDSIAEKAAVYEELSKKISVLEADRRQAEKNLRDLDEKIAEATKTHCTVTLLFRSDAGTYTEIFPIMKEKELTGTVILSGGNLPGTEGVLTENELREIIASGWAVIPEWNENGGISEVEEWMTVHGYSSSGTVLIDKEILSSEVEEALTNAGYSTVICALPQSYNDVIYTENGEEPVILGSMGYVGTNSKAILNDAVSNSAHITFTIGFDAETELFDSTYFPNMLEYMKDFANEGSLEITDITKAMDYRREAELARISAIEKAAAEKDAQKAILAEIDAKINALYDDYD